MIKLFLSIFMVFTIYTSCKSQKIGSSYQGGIYIGHGIVVHPGELINTNNNRYFNFDQASKACTNLKTGGYNDWKIPSITDLEHVYDYATNNRVYGGFPEPITPGVVYISSSKVNAESRWMFYMVSPYKIGNRMHGGAEVNNLTASGYLLPLRYVK